MTAPIALSRYHQESGSLLVPPRPRHRRRLIHALSCEQANWGSCLLPRPTYTVFGQSPAPLHRTCTISTASLQLNHDPNYRLSATLIPTSSHRAIPPSSSQLSSKICHLEKPPETHNTDNMNTAENELPQRQRVAQMLQDSAENDAEVSIPIPSRVVWKI